MSYLEEVSLGSFKAMNAMAAQKGDVLISYTVNNEDNSKDDKICVFN